MRTRALLLLITVGTLFAPRSLQAAPIHQWSQRFGDANYQAGNSVAVDGLGNASMAGTFIGTVDFGGGPLTSASNFFPDIFVAKFGAAGNHLWSRNFGDDTFGFGDVVVAADGSGNVILAGGFYGSVSVGGGPLTSAGSSDIFVAKFDPIGDHLWSTSLGDSEVQYVASVATDGSDNVVIAGRWGGDRPLIETYPCSFAAKLDPNGNELWLTYVDCGDDAGATAVVDGSDNVVVASFSETLGVSRCRVGKLDASGSSFLWYHDFGDYYNQARASVAVDGGGNVDLVGYFFGTVDFGGGPLTSAGETDMFLAKLDANGDHLWSHRFGDSGFQYGASITTDDMDRIVITGVLNGTLDLGGGPLISAGSSDIFLAEFNPAGNHLWSRRYGDADQQYSTSLAAYGSGNIVLTGALSGSADFGGGPLTSAGQSDIFLAKFMEGPLPVLITSFAATTRGNSVEVTWDVWSDEALESFALYRRDDAHRSMIVIANGPFDRATRSHVDVSVEPGRTYHYELLIHSQDGDDIRSPVATVTVPKLEMTLGQNFPNPFKPATTIEYTLSEQSSAVLGVYDAAGRLVVRLDQGVRDAGIHRAEWDGRDADGRAVGSGVYFYRIEGAPHVAAKKMVLVR